MSQLRYSWDDIAFGPDFAIIAKGRRRIIIDGASPCELGCLADYWRSAGGTLPAALEQQLTASGLADRASNEDGVRTVRAYVPSSVVTFCVRPLVPLAHPLALLLLAPTIFASALAFTDMLFRWPVAPVALSTLTPSGLLAAIALFYATMMMHELGHAAACWRSSGAVGGIRAGWRYGLLLMATDVTAGARASARDRALTAITGCVWQGVAACLLIATIALGWTDPATMILAVFAIVFANLYSLVPAHLNDGYLAVLEATGIHCAGPKRSGHRFEPLARALSRSARLVLHGLFIGAAIVLVQSLPIGSPS